MEKNKVDVVILNQEYTIVGDKSKEHIIKVAAHVNGKMKEIEEVYKGSSMGIAVLGAVNIADEYFSLLQELDAKDEQLKQMSSDNKHYVQLWEEAKNGYREYREKSLREMEGIRQQKEELMTQLSGKEREIEDLLRKESLMDMKANEAVQTQAREAEEKYKELESAYFDLQMENIQLKSRIEKMKGEKREATGNTPYSSNR